MKPKSHLPTTTTGRLFGSSIIALLSTLTFAGATILEFDLSPAGSDDAVGLSPANEVPAVLTSTGSGNAVSGGITYNTETRTLSFTIGYGSAAGFTNLTGAAIGTHIHGPAAAGANAPVLFDLAPLRFPAADPTQGGLLYGSIVYTPSQAVSLLASQNYVNIHTSANSGGEIRGQLTRVNSTPEVTGPEDATVECGVTTTYSATIADYDGDAVNVIWSLNGVDVKSNTIAATGTPSESVVTYIAKLPDGFNVLTITATDSAGNVSTSDSFITVEDTIAPVIVEVEANPKQLWPPNHKMVTVKVNAKVRDACGPTTWEIVAVRSSQPVGGKGSGKTSPDWRIIDEHTVQLRAERSGKDKQGRVYTIVVQATDEAGNKSERETVTVLVPHDKRK